MDHDPGSTGPLSVLEGPVVPADESRQLSSRRRYLARLHRLTGGVFGPAPSTRLAATAHGATLLGAFAFWVWLDRGLWFFGDEWDFLVRRGLSYPPASHRSIWFPHNEHWSTLPILLWRGLYNVFHLSSYWPYLIPLLLTGVVVMHLAWRLCRRAGVDPWVATAAVGLLGFLGAGAEDLSSAFQIGFVASVLFGFVALDLLDRPMNSPAARRMMSPRVPPSTRRDILASLAMLASLMCSTVGDAMVVGAAVFLFARRPPKRALAVLALPVTSYAVWFTFLGRPAVSAPGDHFSLVTFTSLPSYVWFGLSSALGQAFNLPSAGAALLVGLAVWVTWNMRSVWQECPSLLGLGAAGITFYVLAGLGRDMTVGASTIVSRYVYVGIAILLPVMAKVLGSAGAGPAARAVVIAFLAATTLGNVGQAETWVTSRIAVTSSLKTQLVATGRLLVAGVRDVSGPVLHRSAFSPTSPPRGSSNWRDLAACRVPPSLQATSSMPAGYLQSARGTARRQRCYPRLVSPDALRSSGPSVPQPPCKRTAVWISLPRRSALPCRCGCAYRRGRGPRRSA